MLSISSLDHCLGYEDRGMGVWGQGNKGGVPKELHAVWFSLVEDFIPRKEIHAYY